MILSPHEIAWLVMRHWDAPKHQRISVAVFLAESGGDSDVIARSTEGENVGQRDHGTAQISGRWHGAKLQANPDWRDPAVNIDIARQIWEERKATGDDPWSAWAVYNSGAYRKYLPDADHALAAPFPPPPRPATAAQVKALAADVARLATVLDGITRLVTETRNHFA